MMALQPAPPLLVDDSGEVLFATYETWFMPDNYYLAVTESQYMFLASNIEQFEDGEITAEQARLCESAFVLNAWTWVDQPARNAPTAQQQRMRQLLFKSDDYDEDDE